MRLMLYAILYVAFIHI